MKKLSILLLLCIGVCAPAWAQEPELLDEGNISYTQDENAQLQEQVAALTERLSSVEKEAHNQAVWKKRSKYFNIGYDMQQLSFDGNDLKLKSDFGISLSWGKTYYLHSEPILGMIKIGLDWSWLDFTYTQYKFEESYGWGYEEDDDWYEYDDYEESNSLSYTAIGMQFGPSITVNPIDHLKASLYFRVTPSYAMTFGSSDFNGSYSTCFNLGLSVAWRAISVGFEQRWGKCKFGDEKINDSTSRIYLGFRF